MHHTTHNLETNQIDEEALIHIRCVLVQQIVHPPYIFAYQFGLANDPEDIVIFALSR